MLGRQVAHLIDMYQQYVSIQLPHSCRFTPSCSEYMKEALLKYGFLGGMRRGIKRVLSCHPFSGKFGYNPLT